MEWGVDRTIIGTDAFTAASSLVTGSMLLSTAEFPLDFWVVGIGVAVAVVTGVLTAAADRSRVGVWAMVGAFVAMSATIVALVVINPEAPLVPVFGSFTIGLGVGTGCNRFVFGVVRPTGATPGTRVTHTGRPLSWAQ